jgi:hypothetical protein
VVPDVGLKLPITGRGLDVLTGKLTTFEFHPRKRADYLLPEFQPQQCPKPVSASTTGSS